MSNDDDAVQQRDDDAVQQRDDDAVQQRDDDAVQQPEGEARPSVATGGQGQSGSGGPERNEDGGIGFISLALDCPDPWALGRFYADLLGGRVDDEDSDDEWVTVRWDGPTLSFQRDDRHVSPDWPRGHQQLHVDFAVADIAAAHRRAVELGAVPLDPVDEPTPAPEQGFRVYADPAGHPFCLCRPSRDAWDTLSQ